MKISFHTKVFDFGWQVLDTEYQDPEAGRIIAGFYVRYKKWSRGRVLRLTGDLSWAKVRYDILHDGKRTSWTVQSPVHCDKYGY